LLPQFQIIAVQQLPQVQELIASIPSTVQTPPSIFTQKKIIFFLLQAYCKLSVVVLPASQRDTSPQPGHILDLS
jgi:hypothetical protein